MLDLISSSGERSMCGQALACPSHPVGLKDRVDGLLGGRWDAVLTSEGSHFAGEPVQFKAVSRLEIVCHRSSHHWRKSRHQSIQLYRKVRRKLDSGCATYSHRLMHKPEEERAHVPSVIRHTGTVAKIHCGRLDRRPDAVLAGYVEQMKAAGIDITLADDMRLDLWKKFVLLSGTSGI